MKKLFVLLATLSLMTATAAFAEKMKEFPAGEEIEINAMKIAAVYLKPIDMEPRGTDLPASQADIHLEADIHAIEGNLLQPFVMGRSLRMHPLLLMLSVGAGAVVWGIMGAFLAVPLAAAALIFLRHLQDGNGEELPAATAGDARRQP